ncbi:XkdQ/YqbQ family protein [Mahella australiensis]|uniref:YqbQ/XkdQ domain-containing protein n=1 Tax=Mahella australiensis (strain DSM 15567 / CIP 107919 / 50-1 BON) TaxID=697281 RepID=F3ZZX3_MAHA5|nr:hypothetical protein [Mahella australiensis]AEE95791.1 hypothetical protein Mahau_0588 [Mahella australiensis 50-1 BON]
MSYQVIVGGKYDITSVLQEGSLSLSDAIDDIAMRFKATVSYVAGLPDMKPPTPIVLKGTPTNGSGMATLFDGIIWDVNDRYGGAHECSITAYERIKYMAESEDEYLFNAGMTASSIIRKIAGDWSIPLGSIADTKIKLAKQIFRGGKNLYSIMRDALIETVDKGGGMYIPRMAGGKLELVPIGNNSTVWLLETFESVDYTTTMEGMVTKVKVVGNSDNDKKLSPVLAVVTGDTAKYGTIQKVHSDSQIKNASQAKTAGEKLLSGLTATFSYSGIDINTIRAGDKVKFDGRDLIVASVEHALGEPGMMNMEIMPAIGVKKKYYAK